MEGSSPEDRGKTIYRVGGTIDLLSLGVAKKKLLHSAWNVDLCQVCRNGAS